MTSWQVDFLRILPKTPLDFVLKTLFNLPLELLAFDIQAANHLFESLQIFGPDERVIHSLERESNGKFTFAAHMDGVYRYCFSNKMSTMTPKIVMFTVDIGEKPKQEENMEGDGNFATHGLLYLYHIH